MNADAAGSNYHGTRPCRVRLIQPEYQIATPLTFAVDLGVASNMHFEQLIENKKRQYTDKYVMVDPSRPELARFKDIVGQVKTVNMSGRALVEFMDYHLNVGWYDIDPEFLKVVDKPPPKVEKPAAKKPAAKADGTPASAAKAPAKETPAAPAKVAGKPSVADILAAARAGKSGGAAAKTQAEAKPAAPKAEAAPAPAKPAAAKVDRSKMSVADMLAAARAGGAPGTAAAPTAAKPQAKATPAVEETADDEAPVEEPVVEAPPAAKTVAKSTEKVDKSKMSIDDMLAWCRQHDAK
jgi:hypothetical protein